MTTHSHSKKSLIAVGVIAALAAGWLGTTYTISSKVENRLTDYIDGLNQSVQNEPIMLLKPRFVLNEINKSFFSSQFTVSVEMENFVKIFEQQSLASMKNSDYSFYSDEEIKAQEDKVNSLPDFIHLFNIKNTANHGPFPNLKSFNFKPALISIDSLTTFDDLSASAQQALQDKKRFDAQTIESVKKHNFLIGATNINFNDTVDTEIETPPFDWHLGSVAIKHDGLKINFNGSTDFNLNAQLSSLSFTEIPKVSDFKDQKSYNKALSLAKQKQPTLLISGVNFDQSYQKGDIPTGTINLSVSPIKFLKETHHIPEGSTLPASDAMNIEGFDFSYQRNGNTDKTYNEQGKITIKPIKANFVDYDFYEETMTIYGVDSTSIQLDAASKNIPNDFLLKSKEMRVQDFKMLRDIITAKIDPSEIEKYEEPAFAITRILDLYRTLSGENTGVMKPFEIKVTEKSDDTYYYDIKVGEINSLVSRESTDLTKPLQLKSTLNSFDFNSTKNGLNISFNDYSTDLVLSLKNFYPFKLEYTFGGISAKNKDANFFNANDLTIGLNLTESEKSIDFTQRLAGKNFTVNNMDLGNFDVKDATGNFNKDAFNNLQDVVKESLTLAINNETFENPKDIFMQNFMAKAPLHIVPLASNGIKIEKAPYSFSSNQGKADASLSFTLKPLTNELLQQSMGSFESSLGLVDNLSFTLDADINYLADTAARFNTLSTMSLGDEVPLDTLEASRAQFSAMIPSLIQASPAAELVTLSDTKLSSTIEFKDGKFTVNGTPKTIEEISGILGL